MSSAEIAAPAAAISREELRFPSGEAECAAVLVRPAEAAGAIPCVVLGHGFGALKEGGPIRCAERFAAAGYAGLAFDYRYVGESGGEPRQLLDIGRQLEDWRAAVGHARRLEGVDPERIVLWGSSFAGGHVIEIAADEAKGRSPGAAGPAPPDPPIAAVISQAPHVDGIATLRGLGLASAARLTAAALLGREWQNDLAPRVAARMPFYRPGRRAGEVSCPILVQVASDDAITPPAPAMEAAGRAPKGELIIYAGLGHFEIYRGEAYERAVADQLDFLGRHLGG